VNDPGSSQFGASLGWAMDNFKDEALAAVNWLVSDIDPSYDSALQMVTDATVPLDTLVRSKEAFKVMRMMGETTADRRIAARFYAAVIAVALARHDVRISTQSTSALKRGFESLQSDVLLNRVMRETTLIAIRRLGPTA
jgi:hypothetical protein